MKSIRQGATNDSIDVRIELSNHQNIIPRSKLSSGSLANKFPIIIDGGKTTIFITDLSKEIEIRQKYETRKLSKAFSRSAKSKSKNISQPVIVE